METVVWLVYRHTYQLLKPVKKQRWSYILNRTIQRPSVSSLRAWNNDFVVAHVRLLKQEVFLRARGRVTCCCLEKQNVKRERIMTVMDVWDNEAALASARTFPHHAIYNFHLSRSKISFLSKGLHSMCSLVIAPSRSYKNTDRFMDIRVLRSDVTIVHNAYTYVRT